MDTLKFDRAKTKKVLEDYYKKYEDFEGKITIGCRLGSVGYGLGEQQGAIVSIVLTGSLNILGDKVPMRREISEEEVRGVFKTVIEDQGYTVTDVNLDSGLNNTWDVYGGLYEQPIAKPYFKGVNVNITGKRLVK